LNYLSASVSVSLLDPVVVSWLERDGRADELRLPPPGPPPSVVAAIPVWLLVPVDEEVDAFFLLLLFPVMVTTPTLRALFAPAWSRIILLLPVCCCVRPSSIAAAALRADREPKLGWEEKRSELDDGTPSVIQQQKCDRLKKKWTAEECAAEEDKTFCALRLKKKKIYDISSSCQGKKHFFNRHFQCCCCCCCGIHGRIVRSSVDQEEIIIYGLWWW
jgi:hypothetical protein